MTFLCTKKCTNATLIQRIVENFIKNSCIYRKKSDKRYKLCHNFP